MSYRRNCIWDVPFHLLNISDGSPITTGGSLSVYVWNATTGRNLATNSPVHEAGGLWKIQLLPAETNFEVVGIHIIETTAVTQLITIVPDRLDDLELRVASVTDGSTFTLGQQTDKPNEPLSSVDDFYNGSVLVFNSGLLQGQARMVSDYVGSTKTVTFTGSPGSAHPDAPFPVAPSPNDRVTIIGRIGN